MIVANKQEVAPPCELEEFCSQTVVFDCRIPPRDKGNCAVIEFDLTAQFLFDTEGILQ